MLADEDNQYDNAIWICKPNKSSCAQQQGRMFQKNKKNKPKNSMSNKNNKIEIIIASMAQRQRSDCSE